MEEEHEEERKKISVLIIEDESWIAADLQKGLKEAGMHAAYVLEGLAGLDRAIDESPDVIILDLGLPDIDGMEVLRRLRANKVHSQVVVYSGWSDPAVKDKARTLGATYLQKTFKIEVFVDRVKAVTGYK